MSTLKNTALLEKLKEYVEDTNFGNQAIGHRLTLSFLPSPYDTQLEDIRYSFQFRHRHLGQDLQFKNATYSEAIIAMIISMNQNLESLVTEKNMYLYKNVLGLIDEDNYPTTELMASTIGNGIISNVFKKQGKTSKSYKTTDNLQNVFSEFRPKLVKYFLDNLNAYQPTI